MSRVLFKSINVIMVVVDNYISKCQSPPYIDIQLEWQAGRQAGTGNGTRVKFT